MAVHRRGGQERTYSISRKALIAVRLLRSCILDAPKQICHLVCVIGCGFAHLILMLGLAIKVKVRNRECKIIGIVLLEHFGDIVACEPITRYLRSVYPNAYIVWFTTNQYTELLIHNPNVDRIVPLCCLTEWILLSCFNVLDIVYNLHANERTCPICEIPLHKNTGDVLITINNYFNFGNLLCSFSKSAGLPPLSDGPKVYLSPETAHAVDALRLPRQFLVLHCKSNDLSKDWLSEKWEELVVRIIRAFDIDVVEVGLTPSVSKGTPRCLDLCGKLTLLETAEVIRRARLFIGIDSGPAHFANAVGTRGVVLLGHYRDFRRYTPYTGGYGDGSNAELLYVDGAVADMPVERVFQAVAAGLA